MLLRKGLFVKKKGIVGEIYAIVLIEILQLVRFGIR